MRIRFTASINPIEAVKYSPGTVLCYVRCEGDIVFSEDKLVCSKRTIVCRFDADTLLFYASRMFALHCAHLWDAPELALDFLWTGDKNLPKVPYSYYSYSYCAYYSYSYCASYSYYYYSYYYYSSSYYSSSYSKQKLTDFFNTLISDYFFGD